MAEKMRVSYNNSRKNNNGVHSPKHNDRDFDTSNQPHIDPERKERNFEWNIYKPKDMTFEEAEKKYYEDHFTAALEAKNERYRKNGHKERIQTMDEYRRSELHCPEETILQIGKSGSTVEPDVLYSILADLRQWQRSSFPAIEVLDIALHDDEATPHVHIRQVWKHYDKDGNETVNQTAALKAMGVQRPDMSSKENRYNNAKMTYTQMMREQFQQICKEHGIDIETEPIDKKSHKALTLTEYKVSQMQAEIASMTDTIKDLRAYTAQLENEKNIAYNSLISTRKSLYEANNALQRQSEELEQLEAEREDVAKDIVALKDAYADISEAVNEIDSILLEHGYDFGDDWNE